MKNQEWIEKLLKLNSSKEQSYYFNLNDFAFEKLKECKANSNKTIYFDKIYSKLCRQFSIKKKDCRELLKYFESIGKIEFVKYKGIKIK